MLDRKIYIVHMTDYTDHKVNWARVSGIIISDEVAYVLLNFPQLVILFLHHITASLILSNHLREPIHSTNR